jgi:O-acetyl-ADP-ribose deacetylase (regulator of RNase III)/membrane-associated phospholipid phosphatase
MKGDLMLELVGQLLAIDRAVFVFINSTIANPVTDLIMPFLTADLHLKIFYGAGLILILVRGNRRLKWAILFSLLTLAVTDQLSSAVIKPLIARPRPCWNMQVHLLTGCGAGFSMPSSHAANLFGQAYFFRTVVPSWSKYLIPLAVMVGLSRVFVGVHYPGDVLIGASLGTLAGAGVGWIFVRALGKPVNEKIKSEGDKGMEVVIEAVMGDITEVDTEAIVNAANNHLWMGSGVAGAIKRKGGQEIEDDAVSKGPIEVGQAIESIAGKLPYKYIIHAAGMGQDLKTNESIIREVTKNSLLLADKLQLKSIAFPSIGTGVGGFSNDRCAKIMVGVAGELGHRLQHLRRVVFVLFGQEAFAAFRREIRKQ